MLNDQNTKAAIDPNITVVIFTLSIKEGTTIDPVDRMPRLLVIS